MTKQIDARGLSCPQPVFLTQEVIWEQKNGTIEILVDDPTARQNIERTATREGWNVEIQEVDEDECLMTLTKK